MKSEYLNKIIGLAAWQHRLIWRNVYHALINRLNKPIAILEYQGETESERELINALNSSNVLNSAREYLERCNQKGIHIIALGEEDYPQRLSTIFEPPIVIFVKGKIESLNKLNRSLAIVGSRKADKIGCDIAEEIAHYSASAGICVVSGLAYGVDAAAHQGALKSNQDSPTVAVLGNGLDTVYPHRHKALAEQIIDTGGLLISHFEPEAPPYKSNFLDRNRLISGITEATVVVQAPLRSGSLATARFALEEGRDIIVVPGCIRDPRYAGSNRLIKQGAHLFSELSDLIEFFPQIENLDKKDLGSRVGIDSSSSIIELLKYAPRLHYQELSNHFKDKGSLDKELLELEFSGMISRHPGNMISLKKRIG